MNKSFLVLQTDFGLVDGAVSAMEGVALQVDGDLQIHHLTHDITPYNIFEASYRLIQTVPYWPENTVFVSVVDPGVGTNRKSVVAKTKSNHYIVTPDNGTLTHIQHDIGIAEMREIEERKHRLKNSAASYTFHGRDVYAYTGAKLASGEITFEEVGEVVDLSELVSLDLKPVEIAKNTVTGTIDVLDVRFGSLWTSILRQDFLDLGVELGDKILVTIHNSGQFVYQNTIPYVASFGQVNIGSPLVYVNSLYRMGIAINQGSFARAYNIGVGHQWSITLEKLAK